jgi:hypothetical protein
VAVTGYLNVTDCEIDPRLTVVLCDCGFSQQIGWIGILKIQLPELNGMGSKIAVPVESVIVVNVFPRESDPVTRTLGKGVPAYLTTALTSPFCGTIASAEKGTDTFSQPVNANRKTTKKLIG